MTGGHEKQSAARRWGILCFKDKKALFKVENYEINKRVLAERGKSLFPGRKNAAPGRGGAASEKDGAGLQRIKLVRKRGSSSGRGTPAARPASMHLSIQAMFFPRVRMI